jgi:TolA-binding protein
MHLRLLLAIAATLGLTGCFATTAQVDRVETRVVGVERSTSTVIAEARQATTRLENLAKDYDNALTELREATAKANARQADFDRSMKQVRGDVEVALHRLEAVERTAALGATTAAELKVKLGQLIADLRDRAGIAILALPSELPTDGPGFVALADKHLADNEPRVAAAVANECIKRYPGTETSGACGLVLGRIAEQEQRYGDAMKILQGVHDGMGGKPVPVVAQALLQIAHLLEVEGKCVRALEVYKYLRSEMGKLPAAKTAKDLMTSLPARCKEGVNTQGKPAAVEKPAPPEKSGADKPAEPAVPEKAKTPAGKAAPADKDAGVQAP